MPFVCDAHVHLYPGYKLASALRAAVTRLDALFLGAFGASCAAGPQRICCLVERSDCNYFASLRAGRLELSADGVECSPCAEEGAVSIAFADGEKLILTAGRQINTTERLEVLALGAAPEIADRSLPFSAVESAIRAAGGIPVINWAPGKWFFSRGRLVQQIIDSRNRSQIVLCDTTLRPVLWPTPRLMRRAAKKGLNIIAGSDSLPLAGEEARIGTYGIAGTGEFDAERPISELRRMLLESSGSYKITGCRSSAAEVFRRVCAYSFEKKRSRRQGSQ